MTAAAGTNWAGSHRFRAARLERPAGIEALQELVAREPRVRALGSRHSFTDIADTDGVLVCLDALPAEVEVDGDAGCVRVGAATRYGDLAASLHERGRALSALASLPHISVAGAVATGTHGSGDGVGSLATAVRALEVVGADGAVRELVRGDADFDGSVVGLGALGVVTRLTLDVEPDFEVRQDVLRGLALDTLAESFDAVSGAAHSVSLFTDWASGRADVWLKSRTPDEPPVLPGTVRATEPLHMLAGADAAAVTQQLGVVGAWHERLPHFRLDHTPSRGEELQSEYLLPRGLVGEAVEELRRLAPRMAPLLQVGEIRTVAADDLWLSSSHGRDVVALHFTWVLDRPGVDALLPHLEAVLLPLGARPHWGKCFAAEAADLAPLYPRWRAFEDLRDRVDPGRVFGNDWLERVLGG
ncbi:D-arabinono-1,4-lactone oxidase [Phycicoccus avicenniae]|uniref:D-arabinono-1,4-lactone oxidase n=1 Tax=Phycicoccus avicenniae TaxID=2828860 RepID=UPI003D27E7A0